MAAASRVMQGSVARVIFQTERVRCEKFFWDLIQMSVARSRMKWRVAGRVSRGEGLEIDSGRRQLIQGAQAGGGVQIDRRHQRTRRIWHGENNGKSKAAESMPVWDLDLPTKFGSASLLKQ